jgi:hypothetical protein
MTPMYKRMLILLLTITSPAILAAEINKCIVGGKTIYSDQACPKNAVTKPVTLFHAAGKVPSDRESVTDSDNRMQDERWAHEVSGRTISRTVSRIGKTPTNTIDNSVPVLATREQPDKAAMCARYTRRIEELDNRARQPQSGATQDQIKAERAQTQSSMFAAKC